MDRENDISFLFKDVFVVLMEHQSTINENMPLRFLLYIARLYEKMIDSKAIYKEELIPIPTPEFIVLYNGEKEYPLETELHLSDAFIEQNFPKMLDLTVRVLNINYEKSAEILQKSKTLHDYSYFIYEIQRYRKEKFTLEESIQQAMKDCIRQDMLKEFLEENGSEVVNMLFTEFNLKDAKEVWEEEAEQRGQKRGEQIGQKRGEQIGQKRGEQIGQQIAQIKIALNLFDVLDLETISKKTGLSVEELQELKKQETEKD